MMFVCRISLSSLKSCVSVWVNDRNEEKGAGKGKLFYRNCSVCLLHKKSICNSVQESAIGTETEKLFLLTWHTIYFKILLFGFGFKRTKVISVKIRNYTILKRWLLNYYIFLVKSGHYSIKEEQLTRILYHKTIWDTEVRQIQLKFN